MYFTNAILPALLTGTALAAPASVNMLAASGQATIKGMSRICSADDTLCTWAFTIVWADDTAGTPCTLAVTGAPASQSAGGPATCDKYTIHSGWSGQFGEDNGFTTITVADYEANEIVYAGYTDKEVSTGAVVSPDKIAPVESIA